MNCVYCDKEITTRSKEHVIHNALGGHLESKDICCSECNNMIRKHIDTQFTQIFSPITTRLSDLKKTSNTTKKPVATAYGLFNGEVYEFQVKGSKIVGTAEVNKKLKRNLTKEEEKSVEIIGYQFNLDNQSYHNGMCKIAFNYAVSIGIPISKLKKKLSIMYENCNVKEINFKFSMFPYIAMNQFDWHIETITPVDLFHHLAIFNVENSLWCYIDLFNTFQCYVLLDENWDGKDIYESYCQKIEENDRTMPEIRIRKHKHILTYSQMYDVQPTLDIDELKKSIKNKIDKAPYKRVMNDIIKEKTSLLEPIIDMMNDDASILYDYFLGITFYLDENDNLIEYRYKRFTPEIINNQKSYISYPHRVHELLIREKELAKLYTSNKFERLSKYLIMKNY